MKEEENQESVMSYKLEKSVFHKERVIYAASWFWKSVTLVEATPARRCYSLLRFGKQNIEATWG